MYKFIVCPQCGKRLCRANLGSCIEIACPVCKINYEGTIDKEGGVHVIPIPLEDSHKTKKVS